MNIELKGMRGSSVFIDDPEGAAKCQRENPDALYFKLKLSNHPAVSINRARAQIVIAHKIIACAWQKIWDSIPLR